MIGRSLPDTVVSANPLDFVKAIEPVLERLRDEERRRIGQAMDCCVAYGAIRGIRAVSGMDDEAFHRQYADRVIRLLFG